MKGRRILNGQVRVTIIVRQYQIGLIHIDDVFGYVQYAGAYCLVRSFEIRVNTLLGVDIRYFVFAR